MAYESAQGITFTFSGTEFLLTSVSFSKRAPEVDVSTLKTELGGYRSYRTSPLREGDELSIEFYGLTTPQMTATGAIAWTIAASGSNSAVTTGLPTTGLCTSAQIQAAAGELIRGSATLRLTAT
jgi:hypothetical protein